MTMSAKGTLSVITGPRAHGIDISKYQVSFDTSVKPMPPVEFVIQRLSYGLMRDERYSELKTAIQPIGLRMAYHYFSTGAPWKAQADFFLELAEGYHACWLDYEGYYNNLNRKAAEDAGQWIAYVGRYAGVKVGLYTSPYFYKTFLQPFVTWPREAPLWIAQYWWFWSPDKDPGMEGIDRTSWDFYQYTDKGDGARYGVSSRYVDLNVFHADYPALLEWLEMDTVTPEPAAPNVPAAVANIDEAMAYLALAKEQLGE